MRVSNSIIADETTEMAANYMVEIDVSDPVALYRVHFQCNCSPLHSPIAPQTPHLYDTNASLSAPVAVAHQWTSLVLRDFSGLWMQGGKM